MSIGKAKGNVLAIKTHGKGYGLQAYNTTTKKYGGHTHSVDGTESLTKMYVRYDSTWSWFGSMKEAKVIPMQFLSGL